jgi:hypothetical protein
MNHFIVPMTYLCSLGAAAMPAETSSGNRNSYGTAKPKGNREKSPNPKSLNNKDVKKKWFH